jgi:hypothetical protein
VIGDFIIATEPVYFGHSVQSETIAHLMPAMCGSAFILILDRMIGILAQEVKNERDLPFHGLPPLKPRNGKDR